MRSKKITTSNNVFKCIIRTIVRTELKPFRKEFKNELDKTEKRLDDKWNWRFSQFERRMDQKFFTFNGNLDNKFESTVTKFRDEIMTALDQITGMFKKHEEEFEIFRSQHKRLIRLEEKVEVLEKIHPQGKHMVV